MPGAGFSARLIFKYSRRLNLFDLLRPSFGNVAPAQIFPCVDIDLNRGVAYRQFKNIFSRRGDEISRALVSFEHPDRRE